MNIHTRGLLISLALLLAFAPLQAASAQDGQANLRITQVDNSNFPKVTVYVSATDTNGNPLGIDPQQLQISENGQIMHLEQVSGSGETGGLTVLLVMDVSGSMNNGGKLDGAKAAARAFVDQLRSDDQAGLLTFNTEVSYRQVITTDRDVLKQSIHGLTAVNDTALFDALDQTVRILQGYSGRKAILVLTDGIDNRSLKTADDVIEAIGAGGLSISVIGLGDPEKPASFFGLDETVLRSLAESAGSVYSATNVPDDLRTLFEQYGRILQSEYRLTYTSPSELRDGVNRNLSVSLNGTAAAEASYNPGGVLPEVAHSANWTLFLAVLAGLVVLLFVPWTVNLIREKAGVKGGGIRRKKSRIKLK